jgi:YHS domain-containing protein
MKGVFAACAVFAFALCALFPGGCNSGSDGGSIEVDRGKVQSVCPVMVNPINKKFFAEHGEKRIYFCCLSCVNEFRKNPGRYMTRLNEAGVILENLAVVGSEEAEKKPAPAPHDPHEG